MSYHLFLLVWGREFVRDFVELAVPFLVLPGNLPALAAEAPVTVHAFTDRDSVPFFSPGIEVLEAHADVRLRAVEPGVMERAAALPGESRKYEIQHHCLKQLIGELLAAEGEPVLVLIDGNFILADGALDYVRHSFAGGLKAVAVDVLRLSRESASEPLRRLAADGGGGARALVRAGAPHLHSITRSFFVDADPFSPYPSQLLWRVGPTAIAGRSFIPHPLAVAVAPGMRTLQSTMDYDLALRAWPDERIGLVTDSDQALVAKLSSDAHHGERPAVLSPSATDLALFIVTACHRRHRAFAEKPIRFHAGDADDWRTAEAAAQGLIDAAYAEVDRIVDEAARLDARMMAYVKSYTGPIESYLSPQLEARLLDPLRGQG